jgi:hypothetical protein
MFTPFLWRNSNLCLARENVSKCCAGQTLEVYLYNFFCGGPGVNPVCLQTYAREWSRVRSNRASRNCCAATFREPMVLLRSTLFFVRLRHALRVRSDWGSCRCWIKIYMVYLRFLRYRRLGVYPHTCLKLIQMIFFGVALPGVFMI